jgi:rhomboid family GlyGly-CTERM serine protease
MKSRSPSFPWAIAVTALAAILAAAVPGAEEWLVYDRRRLASGQFWRLVTGHWVHFSASHLMWNLVALGVVPALAWRNSPHLGRVIAVSAGVIGLVVFWFEPELRWFGGLSGIATALLAAAMAARAKEEPRFRPLALMGLLLLTAKLLWEGLTSGSVFASFSEGVVRTSWLAHVAGLAVGTGFGLAGMPRGRRKAIAARIRPCSRA